MKYRVPFVDVPAHFQRIEEEVMAAVRNVVRKGNLILRDELREFEDQFARLVGTRYAVGVNSGTDALHLTLRALGITQGDEVVTVSHTCVATIAAIVHSGATPVLVDVADDFNMDMAKLDEVITPRVRAIVPVHLNGRACDMARLQDIERKHGVLVVEDCAQALGARFSGQMVGSFGRAGCFSLYPFKMLGAFGDGGMVTTDDPVLAKTVSRLRDYGEDRETGEVLYFGFNSRLDNLQAAVLNVKLKYFPAWVERRRAIAGLYRAGLSDLPQIVVPHFPGEAWSDVYMNYAVRAERRDALAVYLKTRGVEPLLPISLATPVHRHKMLKLERFSLPVTDRLAQDFLYLPISPELNDEQIRYVIRCVMDFYQRPA
ncbi:MAG: DegT/DnrJ/EryC1/StrS family aminotransferase [Nitrospira sp.]|nr:DegT/DnrJ/EryC1/StrS family aminotransferase [Nitrospira sp.]MBS0174027.1 DegT/DnrJ/EryC1/StrS family aminotransferase [Nitrospira sp.]MBX3339087.1 DegT/DnrJ/EryC1/StrS family aminotransferase [Nitrospira sp.]MCW5777995.1 DegT/DnrJ/EryC1/StrS family aminotransferase [Nitrospira sp.]HNK16420.1 DegT/DnrJ/EryC1/StrS family aminotransferase [Nitrospira sp.]